VLHVFIFWVVEFCLLLLTPVTLMVLFFMPISCLQLNRPSGACENGVIFIVVMDTPIHWAYWSVWLEHPLAGWKEGSDCQFHLCSLAD
jgi:hypothetical protein